MDLAVVVVEDQALAVTEALETCQMYPHHRATTAEAILAAQITVVLVVVVRVLWAALQIVALVLMVVMALHLQFLELPPLILVAVQAEGY
jgi:hypothetical protein